MSARQVELQRARAAFDRHASPDGLLPASSLTEVLKELEFPRKTLEVGRGLHKTRIETVAMPSDVLGALSALGIGNAELRSGAHVRWEDFERWYAGQVFGDEGAKRNKLLLRHVTGKALSATHTLPPADFVYGRASVPEPVPLSALIAHKFAGAGGDTAAAAAHTGAKKAAAPAASSSTGPLRPSVRVSAASPVRGDHVPGHDGAVYGQPSPKKEDFSRLLHHGFGPAGAARTGRLVPTVVGGEELGYVSTAGKKNAPGTMPVPKDTRTSALRSTLAHSGIDAAPASATGGFGGHTGSGARATAGTALDPAWKMEQFRDVAPRVPTDGYPLHHPGATAAGAHAT